MYQEPPHRLPNQPTHPYRICLEHCKEQDTTQPRSMKFHIQPQLTNIRQILVFWTSFFFRNGIISTLRPNLESNFAWILQVLTWNKLLLDTQPGLFFCHTRVQLGIQLWLDLAGSNLQVGPRSGFIPVKNHPSIHPPPNPFSNSLTSKLMSNMETSFAWTLVFLQTHFRTQNFSGPKNIHYPKIFRTQNYSGPKNFLDSQNIFGSKIFQDRHFWRPKTFMGPKIFLGPKIFRDQKFFGTQNFSGPKIFQDPKIFGTHNFSEPKNFQKQKFSGTQNFSRPKIFQDPKFF